VGHSVTEPRRRVHDSLRIRCCVQKSSLGILSWYLQKSRLPFKGLPRSSRRARGYTDAQSAVLPGRLRQHVAATYTHTHTHNTASSADCRCEPIQVGRYQVLLLQNQATGVAQADTAPRNHLASSRRTAPSRSRTYLEWLFRTPGLPFHSLRMDPVPPTFPHLTLPTYVTLCTSSLLGPGSRHLRTLLPATRALPALRTSHAGHTYPRSFSCRHRSL
jgi:hypothetical protein